MFFSFISVLIGTVCTLNKRWHFHSVVPVVNLEQKEIEEASGKEEEQGRSGGL